MEERKPDFSSTQEDIAHAGKSFPKSIIKASLTISKNPSQNLIKRSKTTVDNVKRVSFPDKIKKPLHTIYEVEPIIYEVFDIQPKKKSKSKGCNCIII